MDSTGILINDAPHHHGMLQTFEARCPLEGFMNDLIFIAVMVAFFALAALYARFCEKI